MAKLLTFKARRSPKTNAAIAFLAMLAGFFVFGIVPTQWFAAQYAYDPNLGAPLAVLGGVSLYNPIEWVFWGWRLGDIDSLRDNVQILAMIGAGSFVLAIAAAVALSLALGSYGNGMEGLHGSAHWAERDEVNNTGFMSKREYKNTGVVVGSVMFDRKNRVIHPHHPKYAKRYKPLMVSAEGWKRYLGFKVQKRDSNGVPMFTLNKSVVKRVELLRDGKNTHIFAYCPTRSGKGRGMVIPTLTTYPNSVMVNDPKEEAFALTAGFRKAAGQEIIKFKPACTDGTGACWNPLDEIRINTHFDVQDAQMIMSMACDPTGEGLNDYFDKAGYEFLTGLALHVRYAEANGSLEGIAQFLGDPNWDSDKQMYLHMMQAVHDPSGAMGWRDSAGKETKTHPMVANAAKTMMNKEDKDRSGVLSTAKSLLSLYLDPIVARNTNKSDFLVRDLMTGEKPVSLYFVVGPADMQRLLPLTRLFYDLFVRRNAVDMEFAEGRTKATYSFPLLMIIDEMSSLRKLPILQEALGYVAGYGIRLFMLVQDIAQVEELYGDKQTVDSGAETRIVYAPNKFETAEKIAGMTGKTTITEDKVSRSVDGIGFKAGSVTVNTDKIQRDLLTSQEVMSLHDQDVILFVKGQSPIYGRKAFYDENPVMLARAKMAPPKASSVLRQAPAPVAVKINPVTSGIAPEPSKEEIVAEASNKWAQNRAALLARVADRVARESGTPLVDSQHSESKAGSQPVDAVVMPVGGSEGGGSPKDQSEEKTKPRSRYAGSASQALSSEEKARVNELVADIALTEKIAALSAF